MVFFIVERWGNTIKKNTILPSDAVNQNDLFIVAPKLCRYRILCSIDGAAWCSEQDAFNIGKKSLKSKEEHKIFSWKEFSLWQKEMQNFQLFTKWFPFFKKHSLSNGCSVLQMNDFNIHFYSSLLFFVEFRMQSLTAAVCTVCSPAFILFTHTSTFETDVLICQSISTREREIGWRDFIL